MHAVTVLYALGFVLPAIATLVVLPFQTTRAITQMKNNVKSANAWRKTELDAKHREIWGSERPVKDEGGVSAGRWQRAQTEIDAEYRKRARDIRLAMPTGMSFGGNNSTTIADTIYHIGKANLPTGLLALAGALSATIASIWSLYLP